MAQQKPPDKKPQEEKPQEPEGEKQPPPKKAPAAAPAAPKPEPATVLDEPGGDEIETPEQARARARREREQPRRPLPEVEGPAPPPWERLLEVGPDFVLALRPFADGVVESEISYKPAPGFGIHLHWEIFKWLRFHPYFFHAIHNVDIPQDALFIENDPLSIAPGSTISDTNVETFAFGAKVAPTLPITDRLRAWLSAGVGWGRFNFDAMTVTEPSGLELAVEDRSGVFVEFPLGLGISFDVIERWLAIEYEATAAPIIGQSGDAHEVFQVVNEAGQIRNIGPFGAIEVTFLQILGVSLIL